MVKTNPLETVDVDRRRLLKTTATGIAVVGAASLLSTNSAFAAKQDDIRPFKAAIPEEQTVGLRRRLATTRWPTKELVEDRSQGVQLAMLRELAHYWTTEYSWRKCEARLTAPPQLTTAV